MTAHPKLDLLVRLALGCGVAVPFLYYGVQAAAAPYFPGFRFVSTTASELGSDLSNWPGLFNTGVFVLGGLSLTAAAGFLRASRRFGTHPALAGLAAAAVAMNGVQTVWAAAYPMPDPRHGGHPAFIVAMLLLPVLLTAAMWRHTRWPWWRGYYLATLLLLAAMVPVMSGLAGLDTHAYRGLVQRVFTLAIFPPIGVSAYLLLRRG